MLDQTNIDPANSSHAVLLDGLQGNILKSHGRDNAIHLFFQFKDPMAARKWLQENMKILITSAIEQQRQTDKRNAAKKRIQDGIAESGDEVAVKGELFANLILTKKGYDFLGENIIDTTSFDKRFHDGLKKSASKLADEPNKWEDGFKQDFHVAILLAHDDFGTLRTRADSIKVATQSFVIFVHEEIGNTLRTVLPDGPTLEHFGFVDGISQPLFLKKDIDDDIATQGGNDKWDSSAKLSLVLKPDPLGDRENSFGTYVVYRKLEQDVNGFRARESLLASQLNISSEQAGALAVGRFRDGTPTTLFFTPAGSASANNFNYADDTNGAKCPFHAHIRKTNPRGDTVRKFGVSPESEQSHAIVRRGIPYGKPSDLHVGLLFLCLQGDIDLQYEFIQSSWANATGFLNTNTGLDTVVGQGVQQSGGQNWQNTRGDAAPRATQLDFSHFVTMKGGEYFFMPSMSFIRNIAAKLTPQLAETAASAAVSAAVPTRRGP